MAVSDSLTNSLSVLDVTSAEAGTSDSYRMQIERESIKGKVTDLDAVAQAIYKCLNTERYAYAIYSWNYGVELQDLFGKPKEYVFAYLPVRISEALLRDDRIKEVKDFDLSFSDDSVLCKFTAVTIYGNVDISKEVTIY